MAGTRITLVRYDRIDPRLGRNVEHDERSKSFALLPRTTRPKKKTTSWTSQFGALDQAKLGDCTTNAVCQWLNTDFATGGRTKVKGSDSFVEEDAIDLYRLTTRIDPYPGHWEPDDTGSSGNSACKAAVKRGWLKSYSWLFSFTSIQAAIERQPLLSGTLWTNDMFKPVNGLVKVGSLDDSNIAGGHEYLMSGIDWEEEVFEFRNSWGDWEGAHPGGYFAIGFKDYQRLQEADGDVTVPHWA